MSTPDRPTPQYGEYASDDELAAAVTKSGGTPSGGAPSGGTPSGGAPSGAAATSSNHAGASTAVSSTDVVRRKNSADRIATIFLLAFGFVYVIGGISTYLNLGDTLRETMKRLGMGDFEPTSQTAAIGIWMLVSQAVCWVVAAVWSYRRVSQHKISWWVPVVLGVVSFLVLTILLGTVLAADPSFMPKL